MWPLNLVDTAVFLLCAGSSLISTQSDQFLWDVSLEFMGLSQSALRSDLGVFRDLWWAPVGFCNPKQPCCLDVDQIPACIWSEFLHAIIEGVILVFFLPVCLGSLFFWISVFSQRQEGNGLLGFSARFKGFWLYTKAHQRCVFAFYQQLHAH